MVNAKNLLDNFQATVISVAVKFAKNHVTLIFNFFYQDDKEEGAVEVSCFIFSTELSMVTTK